MCGTGIDQIKQDLTRSEQLQSEEEYQPTQAGYQTKSKPRINLGLNQD